MSAPPESPAPSTPPRHEASVFSAPGYPRESFKAFEEWHSEVGPYLNLDQDGQEAVRLAYESGWCEAICHQQDFPDQAQDRIAAAQARRKLEDAAMLIRRLARHCKGSPVAIGASEWLIRQELAGDALRAVVAKADPAIAWLPEGVSMEKAQAVLDATKDKRRGEPNPDEDPVDDPLDDLYGEQG